MSTVKVHNVGSVLRSERGLPLLYQGTPVYSVPVVTAEDYGKWYGVYLVNTNGSIERVEDPSDEYHAVWEDSHIPNPARLWDWARKKRYAVDPLLMKEVSERLNEDWACDNNDFPVFGPNVGRARIYVGHPEPLRISDEAVMARHVRAGEILSVELPDGTSFRFEVTRDSPLITVLKERGVPWP